MERVLKLGQFFYDIVYEWENDAIEIKNIYAFSELTLFDRAFPVKFESADIIPIEDAGRLTVNMGGQSTLMKLILENLSQKPKSDPVLQAIE